MFCDSARSCRCSPYQRRRYRDRISGPLLDRIDIHVEAPAVIFKELTGGEAGEPSSAIRERVLNARAVQGKRFAGAITAPVNARMGNKRIKEYCVLDAAST